MPHIHDADGPRCHHGSMTKCTEVRRLDLGCIVRPAEEAGTAQPRVEPVFAYLVRHADGLILFDTGIGAADPETEAHYRPRRRTLQSALASAGTSAADVSMVVNCHLHFDHCGGNPLFRKTPIVVQEAELATARRGDYTIDELVDFPGAGYLEISGEAELRPGVRVIPTPGHTDGHQSLVIEQPDGTVILAGQAHDFATHFALDHAARQATLMRPRTPATHPCRLVGPNSRLRPAPSGLRARQRGVGATKPPRSLAVPVRQRRRPVQHPVCVHARGLPDLDPRHRQRSGQRLGRIGSITAPTTKE